MSRIRTIPLILAHATITMYRADPNGQPVYSLPVWIGARVEGMTLSAELEEFESTPSGAEFEEYEPGALRNVFIQIQRIWCLPADTKTDFALEGGKYVMVIHWEDRRTGLWHRRTYYYVTALKYDLASNGLMESGADQRFRARYYRSASGAGVDPTPVPVAENEFPVAFTNETALVSGAYLVGHYQFPYPVKIGFCKVVAVGGQTTPTTVALEVAGSLTGDTLAIPTAALNAESSASATLNRSVGANQLIRWKATAGPGVQAAPAMVGLTMMVQRTG